MASQLLVWEHQAELAQRCLGYTVWLELRTACFPKLREVLLRQGRDMQRHFNTCFSANGGYNCLLIFRRRMATVVYNRNQCIFIPLDVTP